MIYLYIKLRYQNYFNSTVAPTSSNCSLSFSASSLATASLITLGALSTNSLASFKPKPVASLTALTTLIFEDPAEVNSTSNSVFSAPASPPPAAPAAATGAAAVTPNSSSIAFTKIV